MPYFNYHAKLKKLISGGEVICYEIVEKHNNLSPAMVFYFKNNPPMPVREYRFNEYFELIEKYEVPRKK